MSNIFELNIDRKILFASQNVALISTKHPSRLLNEHVISYVIKGGWDLKVGNEIIHAKNESVFIQPANIPHRGTENCPAGTRTMFVGFSATPGDKYIHNQDYEMCQNTVCIDSLIDAKYNPEIKKIFLKIIDEHAKENKIKAHLYLTILLCELAESRTYDKSKYSLSTSIKKILDYPTNKNYCNKEIAKMLNVGVRTAETAFKDCFGLTIHQYQLMQKIEHAKFYLEYFPNMKIIDISLSLGFYDEFHFSRQFKKFLGVSPTDYKKTHLKENNISV
jgi:AraC-like DNA-binding protein